MEHVNSILLYVNPALGDSKIVDRAADLAQQDQASVTLLSVVSDYPEDLSEWWNVRYPEKLQRKIVREREAVLDTLAERIKQQSGGKVRSTLRWGKPYLEICKEVIKHGHDMVMLACPFDRTVNRLFHESPALALFRHCPASVWIGSRKSAARSKRLVAAIPWTANQKECEALSEKILRTAADVAAAQQCELHILHVLPLYGDKGRKGEKLRTDLSDYVDTVRDGIRQSCGPVAQEYSINLKNKRIHLLTGTPAKAIPEFVQSNEMDLIVMGTVGRVGLPGMLVGNTVEKVFAEVNAGVLAVKPDGYDSILVRELGGEEMQAQPARAESIDQALMEKRTQLEHVDKELQEKGARLAALDRKLSELESNSKSESEAGSDAV